MNIKEMFGKKVGMNEPMPENETQRNAGKGQLTMQKAEEMVEEMIALDKEGKLTKDIEEYISSEKFLMLLSEFPVKAAVRIFDAEEKAENAEAAGRQLAIDDIYKRKSLPRSMKSAQPAVPEDDFSKMSTEEFNRIKKRLAREAR